MIVAEWIEWYGHGIEGVPDIEEGEGSVEDIVSHHRKVHKSIKDHGSDIREQAIANMHSHRDEGYFAIENMYLSEGTVKGNGGTKLDYYVVMHNPDPDVRNSKDAGAPAKSVLSFEYGHTRKDGTRVKGAWVLHDAAGLPHK